MTTALNDLDLEHLWVIYPGKVTYPIGEKATVLSIADIQSLFA